MFETSYSGTKGTRLIARVNLNQIRMEDALKASDRLAKFLASVTGELK